MIINVTRHYLEIENLKNFSNIPKPNSYCRVLLVDPSDFQLNKFFYKQIGKKHRWIDRLIWQDNKWIDYVNDINLKTYILKEENNLVGYFELIFDDSNKDCEIAYFGILENYIGKKYGAYLLSEAIRNSFINDINRAWVHTCSLDHKNALNNYKSRGMKIFKSEKIKINIDHH